MKFSIISIGTELNLGLITNTNSKYVTERLTDIGHECNFMVTVRDIEEDICKAIGICMGLSDFIIISGGLGPTDDDMTRAAVAKYFNIRLQKIDSLDECSLRFLQYIKNDDSIDGLLRQSYIPDSAIPLRPRIGSASGFILKTNDYKFVVSIPGVPREMRDMFENDVIPFINDFFSSKKNTGPKTDNYVNNKKKGFLKKTIFLTTDISESQIEIVLHDKKKLALDLDIDIGITATPGLTKIILITKAETEKKCIEKLSVFGKEIRQSLKNNIYGMGEESIGDSIGKAIKATGKKISISTAESITGGLISSLITDTPGSSLYFKGSIISYNDNVKEKLLGIDGILIKKEGAVSRKVCLEMARQAKKIFDSDYAVSATGIAGPSSPEEGKDVGLVYCCILGPLDAEESYERKFIGTRSDIKFRTAQFILNRLRLSIGKV